MRLPETLRSIGLTREADEPFPFRIEMPQHSCLPHLGQVFGDRDLAERPVIVEGEARAQRGDGHFSRQSRLCADLGAVRLDHKIVDPL